MPCIPKVFLQHSKVLSSPLNLPLLCPPHRSLTGSEQEELQSKEPLCEGSYQRMGSLWIYVRESATVRCKNTNPACSSSQRCCHYLADVLGTELLPSKSQSLSSQGW